MSEFDIKAAEWDLNPMHLERSVAVAEELKSKVTLTREMRLMEFGAGTGNTGFLLLDNVKEVVLVDNSQEMVRVANEKIESRKAKNIKALHADLETTDPPIGSFDIIVTQLVLHHISDVGGIIKKFNKLLNKRGYLAIADLYKENGSFHGDGFSVHNGFDTKDLSAIISEAGFKVETISKCFTIKRDNGTEIRDFDVFLLIAHLV